MIDIIHSNNPYILDKLACDERITALTRKNADFFETVVRLDSNYANELSVVAPEGKYGGSIRYWVERMKDGENFEDSLMGTITAIDRSNSTHLEVCKDGRRTMCTRILDVCADCRELIAKLSVDFDGNDEKHILSILTQSAEDKDGNMRYNLSFASKFCSYAALFLDVPVQYSKYDNIVSDALPLYALYYLGKRYPKRYFKIDSQRSKAMDDTGRLLYRLQTYKEYSDTIRDIIDEIHKDSISITRDELDHIIWYSLK